MRTSKKQLSSVQLICLSFALLILLGTLLLCLPFATRQGENTPFVDAFLTATSASCVTGLVAFDTYTHWTLFGQIVILLLIQIGGVGILTLTVMLASALKARLGMRQIYALAESVGAAGTAGIFRYVRKILIGVLAFEAIGALLLLPPFAARFGFLRGLYFAIFHAVSAFCNAGFDLMGAEAPYASLGGFTGNFYLQAVVMLLIVIGGLGFFVWADVRRHRFHFHRYALHTKLVLTTTAILIFCGALLFFGLAYASPALQTLPLGEKIAASLFQSVTARTAGFATLDLAKVGGSAQLCMICLMLVGGSSGSTAGGMKTTTLAVLFLLLRSIVRGKNDVEAFGRRLPRQAVRTAVAIFVLYLSLALVCGALICAVEGVPVIDALFETFSAVATVGLTLSLTPTLCGFSKFLILLLMYIGRVGGLTVLLSLAGKADGGACRYPEEHVAVG